MLTSELLDLRASTDLEVGGQVQRISPIRELHEDRGVELKEYRFDIGKIPDWLGAPV